MRSADLSGDRAGTDDQDPANSNIFDGPLDIMNPRYGEVGPSARLVGAKLVDTELSSAVLNGADLREADLSRATLSSARLIGAKLSRANLGSTNLVYANLSGADLTDANVGLSIDPLQGYGADLVRTLPNGDIYLAGGADLTNADLKDANLSGADLAFVGPGLVHRALGSREETAGSRQVQGTGQCVAAGGFDPAAQPINLVDGKTLW
jgi:uncharacterized protein YjbI with pentapeptide repeats